MSIRRLKSRVKELLPVGMSVFILRLLSGELPVQRRVANRVQRTVGRLAYADETVVAGHPFRPHRAVVTERFDSWAEREQAVAFASGAFEAAGIPFALRPERHGARSFVLREEDRRGAILALCRNDPAAGAWHLAPVRRQRASTRFAIDLAAADLEKRHRSEIEKYPEFSLFSHKASPAGKVFGTPRTGVLISFWAQQPDDSKPRPDGYTYEAGTLMSPRQNGIAAYLSPAAWQRALASPTRWPENVSLPHIYEITEPVDVVYTWVDGDDPEWQRRKNAALGATDTSALNETAVNASRYASRDELKYSLRSLEMYANWVRNIYIVTDDQTPSWLDTSHPRVRVVHHREIFSDPDALPVFNSHAIESQLHRIEGLSNLFLYMNDDVLFGRQVQASDFFLSNRMSKYFPSRACLDVDPPSARDLPVLSSAKNARQLMADTFGVTITNKFKHTPMALQRDVLAEMEQRFPELFASVAASRFRHPDDYSIPSGLYHYYAFATGRAVPGSISYGYQDISRADLPIFLSRLAGGNPYQVFCLNDTASTPEQLEQIGRSVVETMRLCYPFKSEFEL